MRTSPEPVARSVFPSRSKVASSSGALGNRIRRPQAELKRCTVENLHLLGFSHEKLTYRHAGRDFRLTDVAGNVVHKVLA
jgi:hypothetical protein